MTRGARCSATSSRRCRHLALNSPAAIILSMVICP